MRWQVSGWLAIQRTLEPLINRASAASDKPAIRQSGDRAVATVDAFSTGNGIRSGKSAGESMATSSAGLYRGVNPGTQHPLQTDCVAAHGQLWSRRRDPEKRSYHR